MSKDKKQEPTQGKELSEWQKRNQEYLQKKAEEEAQLAKEKAQAEANKKRSCKSSGRRNHFIRVAEAEP